MMACVTKMTVVDHPKRVRGFYVASERCQSLEEAPQWCLLPVSTEEEAVSAVSGEQGLAAIRRFRRYIDFYLTAQQDTPRTATFLICQVQRGRVYEHGLRHHRAPFDKPPPHGFDSGYNNETQCHRLWRIACALPRYIVAVTVDRDGLPSHWSGSPAPSQGWSLVPERDLAIKKILQACLVTEGHHLGHGRDVVEHGHYNRLDLALAWRIEHPSLWKTYTTERKNVSDWVCKNKVSLPAVRIREELWKAASQLPEALVTDVNEVRLVHGSKPETILPILTNGLNERFSVGLFGAASYLAEDAGKTDHYVTSDKRLGQVKELHDRLFRDGVHHPNEPLYYIFVCRVVLGHVVRTQDGETDMNAHARRQIFAAGGQRELATIPGVSPPIHHHALLAECGGRIHRYREFMQFHASRIYPEYLIAYKRR